MQRPSSAKHVQASDSSLPRLMHAIHSHTGGVGPGGASVPRGFASPLQEEHPQGEQTNITFPRLFYSRELNAGC